MTTSQTITDRLADYFSEVPEKQIPSEDPKPRVYLDREIQAALARLAENNRNIAKTARELGIPRTTLIGWQTKDSSDRLKELEEQLHALEARICGCTFCASSTDTLRADGCYVRPGFER